MPEPAIRVILLPRDTNAQGSIFGGVILSHIDLAGVTEARKHAAKRFVTVAIKEVVFKEPVYVGDTAYVLAKRPTRVLNRVEVPDFGTKTAALKAAPEFRVVEKQLLDALYAEKKPTGMMPAAQ